MSHPQVRRMLPTGEWVEVDEGIADLLAWLWSRGVETEYSCQGDSPRELAYIAYRASTDEAITDCFNVLYLPYVLWMRYDDLENREGGPLWCVYFDWREKYDRREA